MLKINFLALGRRGKKDQELKASLNYVASLKPAWATPADLVCEKNKNES